MATLDQAVVEGIERIATFEDEYGPNEFIVYVTTLHSAGLAEGEYCRHVHSGTDQRDAAYQTLLACRLTNYDDIMVAEVSSNVAGVYRYHGQFRYQYRLVEAT